MNKINFEKLAMYSITKEAWQLITYQLQFAMIYCVFLIEMRLGGNEKTLLGFRTASLPRS